jgi:hypothetical protein
VGPAVPGGPLGLPAAPRERARSGLDAAPLEAGEGEKYFRFLAYESGMTGLIGMNHKGEPSFDPGLHFGGRNTNLE